MSVRRLPVYLLVDCSGSMYGEPICAVTMGIKALVSDLRNDPQALETAALSVIKFNGGATQVVPLTDLTEFQEPTLEASGGTSLGAGLRLLLECVNREVKKSSPTEKGDWKPLVFLLTDGQPTDQWREVLPELRAARLNIIACAAGPYASTEVLKEVTETVIMLAGLEPDQMRSFFKWVSSSVKAGSMAMTPGKAVALPALPPQIQIVP
jgi:uncharacterized protein YegL